MSCDTTKPLHSLLCFDQLPLKALSARQNLLQGIQLVVHSKSQKVRTSVTRFGEISPFGKNLLALGKFLTVYFLFGKMLSLLWQICDIIGLIFGVANGQILKNILTIWSHWLEHSLFYAVRLNAPLLCSKWPKRTSSLSRPDLQYEGKLFGFGESVSRLVLMYDVEPQNQISFPN